MAIEQERTYEQLDVQPIPDGVADSHGYTGQRRPRRQPHERPPLPMTEAELIALFLTDNKMSELTRRCREVDPAKNGVVTVVELDDIMRLLYPDELRDRDLSGVVAPFCALHNKILMDYRGFRDSINAKLKAIESNFRVEGGSAEKSPARPMLPASDIRTLMAQIQDYEHKRDSSAGKARTDRDRSAKRLRESASQDRFQPGHRSGRGVVAVKELLGPKRDGDPAQQPRNG